MLRARVLEERLITMYKQGDGYFWIGGPGEEAFNVPLGLLVDKGMGVDHDYLHLHYRSSGTLLAMGADPVDSLRQMKNTATDPYSQRPQLRRPLLGAQVERRAGHVADRGPVLDRDRHRAGAARGTGAKGITIVQGGDAGTAEGDFATCLVWSSRKGNELPHAHDRHEQPLRHLDAVRRASTATTRSPIAARRSACRRRRSTATIPRAS